MTEVEFELHAGGYFCWILANPRVLAVPIPIGGKLNLWKFQVDPARLVFREPEPPKQPPKQQPRKPAHRKK